MQMSSRRREDCTIVERLTPSKNLSNLVLFRGEIFYLRPHKIGVYEVSKNSTYCTHGCRSLTIPALAY